MITPQKGCRIENVEAVLEEIKSRVFKLGTQKAVAESIGTDYQKISAILHGRELPSLGIAKRLGFEKIVTYRKIS